MQSTLAATRVIVEQHNAVPDWLQIVAAATAGIGGVGAAIGAIASWRSASQSSAASKEAARALAVGTRPALMIALQHPAVSAATPGHPNIHNLPDGPMRIMARIMNSSEFPATDLVASITLGAVDRTVEFARLDPYVGEIGGAGDPAWMIDLGAVSDAWPAHGDRLRIAVRYSDSRGLWRYESTLEANYYELPPSGDLSGNVPPDPNNRPEYRLMFPQGFDEHSRRLTS